MIKATKGVDDFATLYPELAKEWHIDKNEGLSPSEVTASSGKKVWWKCSKGHEWQTAISNRTKRNSGCPYCAGKKPIVGVNDLETLNPQLALQWHPTKNGSITPRDVMTSSKRKFWWICEEGHEWEANLDSRNKGHGCPYCSGRRAVPGINDLLSLRPDIAKLWHPTKNGDVSVSDVTVASGVKYWWLGECGHEWQTKVSTMCDKNTLTLCPVCSSQNRTSFPEQAIFYYLKKLFSDTVSRFGTQRKEIDVYIPSLSIGFEYDGMRYHSDETEFKEREKDIFFSKQGIKLFHLREREETELSVLEDTVYYRPWDNYIRLDEALLKLFELAMEYCGLQNISFDINVSRDNVEILNLYMKKKLNDGFAAKHPNLLAEWHPTKNGSLDPWLITEKSNQKFWWLCQCGHEWQARVNDRVNYSTGCPVCAKERQGATFRKNLVEKRGSLSEHYPQIALEWDVEMNYPLTPDAVTPGSNKKVFWKCSYCGHSWEAYIANRTRKGQGCPKCRKTRTNQKDIKLDENGNSDKRKVY